MTRCQKQPMKPQCAYPNTQSATGAELACLEGIEVAINI